MTEATEERELRPEELHVEFSAIGGRLDQGRRTIERITAQARDQWSQRYAEELPQLVEDGPTAISNAIIPKSEIRDLQRQFAREMGALFQDGQDHLVAELNRQRDGVTLRDEEPEIREIRELFLARARAMSVNISRQVERTAQAFAEDMWRTLGTDGITPSEIDEMIGNITTVADREGRKAAVKNVSESYNMGRHYRAMRHRDEIGNVIYSALMDLNTCPECEEADGTQVALDSEAYYRILPPHRDCFGHGACRCIYIYVLRSEIL